MSLASPNATGLPDRRRFLSTAGAAGALGLSALPALAAGAQPDAALLALREPYERTLAGIAAVSPAHDRAEAAYFALRTARPELDERALRKKSGIIPAERAYYQALSRNGDVIAQIVEMTAMSVQGASFKAFVSSGESNNNPDLIDSIIDDLIAMGGRNA